MGIFIVGLVPFSLSGTEGKKVYGVEICPGCHKDAHQKCSIKQLCQCRILWGKAEEVLPEK